jgi:hypothetical protein
MTTPENTEMKHYPAWLAAGLLVSVVLACNFSAGTNSNSNSDSGPISKMSMAKDNGSGDPGDETNTFSPGDHTIHCLLTLRDPKEGIKITFVWWAVDAGNSKNERIKDLDYTTESDVKIVHGHLSSTRDWPRGKYKVEAQINGNTEKTVSFTVD